VKRNPCGDLWTYVDMYNDVSYFTDNKHAIVRLFMHVHVFQRPKAAEGLCSDIHLNCVALV